MGFSTRCFCCSERLVCYIKRRKSFFHDLFSRSMTWEYRGLQGVTGGYKGLQGVTKGDKGSQGVAKDYRNIFFLQKCQFCLLFKSMFILSRKACFLTRTSPNTFSGCILHKRKRLQNFQFLTKTME